MKRNYNPTPTSAAAATSSSSSGKQKNIMFDDQKQQQQDDDELFAVLGYKVKPCDMFDVANKIEHLEGFFQNDDVSLLSSQLASDSNHQNPTDLNSWLNSMIHELDPLPEPTHDPVSDLTSIVYPPNKKPKNSFSPSTSTSFDPTQIQIPAQVSDPGQVSHSGQFIDTGKFQESGRVEGPSRDPNPVVIVDSQENGIRLVHTLMACAEAVQEDKMGLAENLVKQAGMLAVAQAGAMRKVATYFAEALARKIYRVSPGNEQDSPEFLDLLQMHFYETCPYLKFAHFTANQAILESFVGKKKVHVIDFGLKQGIQWPALMQALALRPGGPPSFRLTGVGPPGQDGKDYLQEVGWKLAQLADNINVEFEFRGFVANSLADLEPGMFDLRTGEVVAVNSIFEFHKLLARPGSVEKVLSLVKDMKPDILTVVEHEANHNGLVFLDRFTESLHYYSTMFDSLESSGLGAGAGAGDGSGGGMVPASDQDKIMSEVYLGKQICNVVACDGIDRVERHETLTQWTSRLDLAGFEPVHLGSNAFKQASMLLALFAGGDGYRVEENNGCLMLGWHTRPLITTSAWKIR